MPSWSASERLDALQDYAILDTPYEKDFDDIVALAAHICDMPISIINLIDEDRQWFKAEIGFGIRETPLDNSICAHAILQNDFFVIPDTTLDNRFSCNPLVIDHPNLRFYAGALLETPEGLPLGTLCVLDYKPRELSEKQILMLKALARQVMSQMELRRTVREKRYIHEEVQKAFSKLGESEAQFRQLADSIPQLAWMADETGYIFWYNQRWYDYTGSTFEEMQGWGWQSVHDPIELPRLMETWKHSLATGKVFEELFPLRRDDGEMRWHLTRAQPIRNESGEVIRWFGTNTDIEDKKRSEDALKQKDLSLRTALKAGRMGTWELDIAQKKLTCSETCKLNYGLLPTDELSYEKLMTLLHPDDVENWQKVIGNGIETADDFTLEYRVIWPDHSVHWVYVRGSTTAMVDGKATKMAGVSIDITNQHLAEEALRNSERFTQSIIDSSPDCIKVLDLQGNILSINQGGCNQLELDEPDIYLNKPWLNFWQNDCYKKAKMVLEAALEGETAQFDGFNPTFKGTPKWWEVIVTPIYNKDGKTIRILSISRDITNRKALETAAKEAQNLAESANLAKSEFLANMSHEIRTPMNAVIGLSTILARSEGLNAKQKDYVRTLQLSADSLLGLINDLLDISKIESRSIELEHIPFSITQLMSEVISMMSMRAKEKGLEFKFTGENNKDPMLMGDPMRLRQIIINLCSNAIKFTEKGGVYISVSYAPSQMKGVKNVSFTITDTGIGIATDKQETIFQKFIQADSSINRKYGGTGLGLAITKTLTEIMNGTITIESTPGFGSTFTVMLPLMTDGDTDSLLPETAQRLPEKTQITTKHRILLVEDYAANVLVAGTYLEHFGYQYDVAENGYIAVEKIKANHYLAVLMDVQMHGINGFETTKQIRAYERKEGLPRVPIIGMTAHALIGDRERCIAAEMDDYISKPYNPDILQEKLKHYAQLSNAD